MDSSLPVRSLQGRCTDVTQPIPSGDKTQKATVLLTSLICKYGDSHSSPPIVPHMEYWQSSEMGQESGLEMGINQRITQNSCQTELVCGL